VVNDTLAGHSLVVIYDDGGHGARAYTRGTHTFRASPQASSRTLVDEAGRAWQVTEAALVSDSGEQLFRLPGHMAYWFGWFSFYPRTAVYGVREP
jgi:Protein of unknown function (DUF3179)